MSCVGRGCSVVSALIYYPDLCTACRNTHTYIETLSLPHQHWHTQFCNLWEARMPKEVLERNQLDFFVVR